MYKHIWNSLFISLFVVVSCRLLFSPQPVIASVNLPIATVINPIRGNELGLTGVDLLASLKDQWKTTKEVDIRATWLWQYSALENNDLISYAKSEMKNQEFGIFLEVDHNLAAKSHVTYRGRGPWYFSDGLFLLSYDPGERKKIIDTVFSLFHKQFGYYPKTIGAWWSTGDTLKYLHEKYGVIAALRAADQYDLDAYSIWGTPWSVPYVSDLNAAIPAESISKSSNVVTMQWADRDPFNGYGRGAASTFSFQDYTLNKLDLSYFEDLMSSYAQKPFDQVVIGFEGGYAPGFYEKQYKSHLTVIKKRENEHKIVIETASQFADQYLKAGKTIQRSFLLTNAYHNSNQAFWYMSPFMRVGIQKKGDVISLVDLRDYSGLNAGQYNILPNSQPFLRINTTALLDSARFPGDQKILASTSGKLSVTEEHDRLIVKAGDRTIAEITPKKLTIVGSEKNKNENVFMTTKKDASPALLKYFGVIYLLYLIFIFVLRKKTSFTLWDISLLVPSVILGLSFFQTTDGMIFLDKKQLIFSSLLTIPLLSFYNRLVLMFFIVPIAILLLTHSLLILRTMTRLKQYLYGVIILVISAIFIHIPYFPLDRSTYLFVGLALGLLVLLGICISLCINIKTKSKKKTLFGVVGSGIAFVYIGILIVFSRNILVITPQDIDALTSAAKQGKSIAYILPTQEPIYKQYKPVMFEDYFLANFLTRVSWNGVRGEDLSEKSSLIVAPRYIGADFSEDQARKMLLKRIFDNADYVIYRK